MLPSRTRDASSHHYLIQTGFLGIGERFHPRLNRSVGEESVFRKIEIRGMYSAVWGGMIRPCEVLFPSTGGKLRQRSLES